MSTKIDCTDTVAEYVFGNDWRIKANSNTTYSNAGLVNNTAGKVIANYWLDKVYSYEEGEAHRSGDYHIHDLDCLTGYCAGWNLRTLLNEGFNGVRSRVNSRPPKHFISALGQMVNFLGILQSEWAGAQAFSSFDTFLAPYVFKDKLTFEQVKSAIAGFVYGLNVPSRWGQCIPSTYKCLKGDGTWVTYDSLKVGDEIYVIDTETGDLKKDIVTHINLFDAPGTMHRYKNKHGFSFDVTDKHRVIYRTGNNNNYSIRRSEELINRCNSVFIPISPWGSYKAEDCNIPDNILEFVTFILCDGCIVTQPDKSPRLEFYKSPQRYGVERFEHLCEQLNIQYSKVTVNSSEFNNSICYKYRLKTCEAVNSVLELLGYDKHKQPSFIKDLSSRQANLMLDTWVKLDGFSDSMHSRLQADTKSIHEMLAYLAIIAGRSVELGKRLVTSNNKTETSYAYLYKRKCRSCSIEEVNSVCNQVWCPTTNTGTFVCMSDTGCIFLTGNSPFTNVTIDWTVPDDLKNVSPLSGGEHLLKGIKDWDLLDKAVKRGCSNLEDLTYKHFQTEMNIIQKAYYEVMTEGDSTGQPFTFPIPTVNITEDFDWNGENVLTLFENTAKIGSSYFQNFVGSQYKLDENGNKIPDDDAYKPGAVRSMCPMPYDTLVLVSESLNNKAPIVMPIGDLYKYHNNDSLECYYKGKWDKCHVIKTEMKQKVYELHTADGCSYKFGAEHLQPVYTGEIESTVPVKLIRPGYYIPFSKGVIDTKCRKGGYILGLVAGALVGSGYIDGNTYVFCHIRKSIYKRLLKAFNSYHIISSEYNSDGTFTLKVKGNELTQLLPVILDNIILTERVVSSSLYCRIGVALALIRTRGYTQEGKTFIRLYDNKTAENANRLFKSLGFLTDYHVVSDTCIEIEYCKSYKSSNDSRAKLINGTWYKEVVDIDTYTPTDDLYCFEVDNSDHLFMLPDGLITHNCRLQLDLNELRKRGNGLFGSAESTGSIGVVTINLARLGYVHAGDKEGLYKSLDKLMDKAKSTLEKKRKVVSELFDAGLYPYTKRYLPAGFINHFSTIGVNGGNEMIRNFTHDKENICTSWGKEFAEELLEHMRSKLREYQHETGNLYNLEASPGEGACYRFAREDKKRFPDIIQAGHEGHNYYTNSTQIPVNFTEDLFAALKLQDDLQTRYSGGTVFHMYMSEMVSSPEACRDMVRKVLTVFRMPYITVTPLFSVCDKHGYLRGKHEYCPLCDEEIIQHERSCCK